MCIRSTLFDCLPDNKSYFKQCIATELKKCESYSEGCPGDAESIIAISPPGLQREISPGHVNMLSPELQTLVKRIQSDQAAIKANLKCHLSSCESMPSRLIHNSTQVSVDEDIDTKSCQDVAVTCVTAPTINDMEELIQGRRSHYSRDRKNSGFAARQPVDEVGMNDENQEYPAKKSQYNQDVVMNSSRDLPTINDKGGQSQGNKHNLKREKQTKRLQDKRYMDLGAAQPVAEVGMSDEDWELQEAIRLSLMIDSQQKEPQSQPSNSSPRLSEKSEQWQVKKSNSKASNRPPHGPTRKAEVAAASTSANAATPPTSISTVDEVISRCLLCDEEFNTDDYLCCVGSCNHACICGVCLSEQSTYSLFSLTLPFCGMFPGVLI